MLDKESKGGKWKWATFIVPGLLSSAYICIEHIMQGLSKVYPFQTHHCHYSISNESLLNYSSAHLF